MPKVLMLYEVSRKKLRVIIKKLAEKLELSDDEKKTIELIKKEQKVPE